MINLLAITKQISETDIAAFKTDLTNAINRINEMYNLIIEINANVQQLMTIEQMENANQLVESAGMTEPEENTNGAE